jgi:hypothetical protein
MLDKLLACQQPEQQAGPAGPMTGFVYYRAQA